MNAVTRPQFAEGQVLAAADLVQLGDYPRGRDERHNRFLHRWGIAYGLTLDPQDAETSDGQPYKRIFVTPGLAIDGEGREVLVTETLELSPELIQQQLGSALDDTNSFPVFITSQYRETGPDGTRIAGPCGTGSGAAGAVEEGFSIFFGQPGDETFTQVPSPLSSSPSADTGARPWNILIGFVTWDTGVKRFAGIDDAAADRLRVHVGINAASVAGDGSCIALQPKSDLQSGDTVLELCQSEDGPTLLFGTFKSATEIEPLLEVTPKGDVKAKGSLFGKRTGNSVAVQSGLASDGTILPLPPGVTEDQVAADDGPAVHVQVTPEIDPAASPEAGADYGAQIVECRVDEDRRVHCRIAWTALPIGVAPVTGPSAQISPGTVRYTVAVSTTEEE